MLGEKHPDEYPRFRDCFIQEDLICVYTRVGGNNRDNGYGEEELYEHPNYLKTEDDEFDNTYASYYFSVPEEWKEDFDKIIEGKIKEISSEYKDRLYKVYPKLKDTFDTIFK